MNESLVTRQKLLVAGGNKFLSNKKTGLLWELRKKNCANDKKLAPSNHKETNNLR